MTRNAPTALPGAEAAHPRVRSGRVPPVICHCSPATPSLPVNRSVATAGPEPAELACRSQGLPHCIAAARSGGRMRNLQRSGPRGLAETAATSPKQRK